MMGALIGMVFGLVLGHWSVAMFGWWSILVIPFGLVLPDERKKQWSK